MTLRLDVAEFHKLETEMNCELQTEVVKEIKFNLLLEYGKIDYIIDTYAGYYDAYAFAKNLFPKENSITLFNTTIDKADKIAHLLEKYRTIHDYY